VLDDHAALGSIGSVGDAYENAMAESFIDSFKTELIADRVRRTRSRLELAIVEYVAWFNNERLHTSRSAICRRERSSPHTLRRASHYLSQNQESETPNPVSAEPSPAHYRRCYVPAAAQVRPTR